MPSRVGLIVLLFLVSSELGCDQPLSNKGSKLFGVGVVAAATIYGLVRLTKWIYSPTVGRSEEIGEPTLCPTSQQGPIPQQRQMQSFSHKEVMEAVKAGDIQSLEKNGLFASMACNFYSKKFDRLVREVVLGLDTNQVRQFVSKLDPYHKRRFIQTCFDNDLDSYYVSTVKSVF